MFGKIMNKMKKKDDSFEKKHLELVEKISKMNLTDMRLYVINKMQGFDITEEGVVEVLKKLTSINEDTSKRYLELDDMDSKIKKGFELILSIAENKKITIDAIELIQEFINVYSDIITKYDTENKQIYGSRLKDSIEHAIMTVGARTDMRRRENILNS